MTQAKTNIDKLKDLLTEGSNIPVRRAQRPDHTVTLTTPIVVLQSSSPEWREDPLDIERRFVLSTLTELTAKE